MGRIICGLDLETTGLNHETDYLTEIAWVIKDTDDPKPLKMESHFVLPRNISDVVISEDNYALTKISHKHLALGLSLPELLGKLQTDLDLFGCDAIMAHNGAYFDRPFLLKKLEQAGYQKTKNPQAVENILWLDTYTDIIYPKDCRYVNLTYLAAYHGFINPFPHAALSDVQTMLNVASRYDIELALERARSPWVVVRAEVSFYDKDKAKERRYYWERWGDGSEFYPKCWVKRVRLIDLESERSEAGFPVILLPAYKEYET